MGRIILYVSLLLFSISQLSAQNKIFGYTLDSNRNSIDNVSVILKEKNTGIIKSYTYSDSNGYYLLEGFSNGQYILIFSSLSYNDQEINVMFDNTINQIEKDLILQENEIQLDEVIIKSERPITIKKDTIVFNVSSFINGNEQVVEDMLKKIPGIEIDDTGSIKVNGKEVEKVMIEGDDFFERGYRVLTKNMPSDPINKVEVLKKYSNNKLLKNIEESDRIALNLKLKEDAKRVWFGNVELSYGLASENRYEAKGNLLNFGKKNKYYFLINLNNIGYNATGDISHLIKPKSFDDNNNIGNNQSTYPLIELSSSVPSFKKSRTNFNNAELLSLNAIFNPNDRLKIKTLGFLNWDEKDFFKNSIFSFTANETGFTNIEDKQLRSKEINGFGKLDIFYDISKNQFIEATTKYNITNETTRSNLVFNDASTIENLKSENTFFDQKISYTNKIDTTKVLLFTGRFIREELPQDYSNNQFIFQDLFPDIEDADNIQQLSSNQMQFAGLEAHFLNRMKNDDLLELKVGNKFRQDKLGSNFILKSENETISTPDGFQNNVDYLTNDLYAIGKYLYRYKKITFTGKVGLHHFYSDLDTQETTQDKNRFYINPSIGLDWQIDDTNTITSSYSYSTTNAKIVDVYNNYTLNGFRSFSRGTGGFNQLNSSSVYFNYQLGSWKEKNFVNVSALYSKDNDYFSNNTIISQNFSQAQKIVIKDRDVFSSSANIDSYIDALSSNIKLSLGYSRLNFVNFINQSNQREIVSESYRYGAELRSGFSGFFNFHIGTKWTTSNITTEFDSSLTNNLSFLDISIVPNNRINFQFQSERYFFGNLSKDDNTYYFLDFNANFTVKPNKLSFALTGKNLFNTERFINASINDIGSSTIEYRLLPSFVLLKIDYRF